MVEIRPFKAVLYDWDEVDGDPAQVTSPPYDVLPADEVVRLKKLSLHNVTHVTLPDPVPGKEESTKYEQAAKTLKSWRKEGILHQQKVPGFFVYDETYSVGDERRTVRGLVGLLRLDPEYDEVRPHEKTHKGPINDRYHLLQATGTDLEPIQFLYTDTANVINELLAHATEGRDPIIAFTDPSGTEHRVWPVENEGQVEQIAGFFEAEKAYIADGHHRYATACRYAKDRRADAGDVEGPQPYDYKLSVFVNRDDPGLTVFPTHRLVRGLDDLAAARNTLAERFGSEAVQVSGDAAARGAELARLCAAADPDHHRFAFYWGDGAADIVDIPKGDETRKRIADDHTEAWKELDVVVLHHVVLPSTLGVDDSNAGERLRYTRIDEEAVAWVDDGQFQASVFMNPTPLAAVTTIADAGEYMPQKSTYFQPKLQSGLLFSPLK